MALNEHLCGALHDQIRHPIQQLLMKKYAVQYQKDLLGKDIEKLSNNPNNHEAFYNYLNTINSDKLVAVAIGGSCGGFVVLQELKDITTMTAKAPVAGKIIMDMKVMLARKCELRWMIPENLLR